VKTIIAGSRGIEDYDQVKMATFMAAKHGIKVTEVVSGHARGIDRLGERWAAENGIPVKLFVPDWDKDGKRAGLLRNAEMAEYADALIAIWDGASRGTKNMIDNAEKKGLKVYTMTYTPYTGAGDDVWSQL